MGLSDLASHAIERTVGRLSRRAAGWLFVLIFMLVAIYQATTAVSVALELKFGPVEAHLIVAAFYLVAAFVTVMVLWATARRSLPAFREHMNAWDAQPELQMAQIVEAMLLGYSLSRRK